uniref:Uncharacterized protein n=1 Tax=Mycena chlorophos TaxID=658473 RepID=A0ABQ0LF08_MYCCL|nr:predicted protein [Mycena chlorophos]
MADERPTTASPASPVTAANVPLQQPTPVRNLVPLGSQAPPHPKKFSAVNINKKFLEKNSTSSAVSPAAAANAAAKAASPVSRPSSQTANTHSRLVTAKLTTAAQGLGPTPGWSRPSSATPPTSTTPAINDPAAATAPSAAPAPSARPTRSRDNSGQAWGNPRSNQPRPNVASQMEFPTAAEAAAPRRGKPTLADRNTASRETVAAMQLAAAASKQARLEEADTFRGVHLDPNAHHWDEMEEDDDNFLDGVIEFGDGRQYKIEAADLPADASSATLVARDSMGSLPSPPPGDEVQSNVPVSKEERFADDFDRSWPRSRASPSVSTRELPPGPSPISPTVSMHSPSELSASRGMLFNERSNKLEPYNKVGPSQKRDAPAGRGRGLVAPNERQSRAPAPSAPAAARPPVNAWTQRKEAEENRGRPSSTMGPPPVPPPGPRQRPPHLEGPPRRTSTSRDSQRQPPSASEPPSSARRAPSQSPALSHTSAAARSPVAALAQLSTTELDEARKDVMQSAAARAKARRQQEEEEREREKERARRKAAEIQEKLATEKATKEAAEAAEKEAVALIESAAKLANARPEPVVVPERPLLRRPSEMSPQSAAAPSPPTTHRRMSSTTTPVETQASWRSKPTAVLPPAQAWPFPDRPAPLAPALTTPTPSFAAPTALEQVESLTTENAEELEVVDFSDLGKFVGVTEEQPPPPAAVPSVVLRPARPTASDFFDDRPAPPPAEKVGPATWRRQEPEPAPVEQQPIVAPVKPRTQHKEAAMSTLDDVMSRIKGALDTMQTTERERPQQPPQTQRWVPPAARPRPIEPPEPREEIVTGCEPPRSPKPAWGTFTTRLPRTSQAMEPVSRKQLALANRPNQLRWDILSFDPPVEGMSKRELTVNEILFRRVPFKGKSKFKVLLPNPKVAGPKTFVAPVSRPIPDALSSWRKAPSAEIETGLNTMSRSPPPDIPSEAIVSSRPDDLLARSKPKMPVGSSVAFYRDSLSEGKSAVNFTVSSELEGTPTKLKPSILVSSPARDLLSSASAPFVPRANGLSLSSESSLVPTEAKSSDGSSQSHQTALWARTSLGGLGPDPEHLKAVWSSSSNKAAAVNSLEGIADDLTAIPFTLQDVKSEDGGTPPPTAATTSAAPSRMSLHDVTRAFQQVPTSSNSSNIRPPISPPSTSAPVARPVPNASYPYPLPAPAMRPNYGPYSPIQAQSVMYPMPPNPRVPMNGHAPLYSQPVWMAAAPPSANMMRPAYPQLFPYPTPAGTPMFSPAAPQPNGARAPMYPPSPILMQTPPPMPVGYMPMGRGQMRNDNTHPQQPPNPMPSPGGFNPVSPASFVRPTW